MVCHLHVVSGGKSSHSVDSLNVPLRVAIECSSMDLQLEKFLSPANPCSPREPVDGTECWLFYSSSTESKQASTMIDEMGR
jgi:hypothetical protein